jgi:hypothetical protein
MTSRSDQVPELLLVMASVGFIIVRITLIVEDLDKKIGSDFHIIEYSPKQDRYVYGKHQLITS